MKGEAFANLNMSETLLVAKDSLIMRVSIGATTKCRFGNTCERDR